jgi:fumarate reductase flavoprotein subunit
MHGANRLGGNGVANSTVFGGIAGDVMADFIASNPHFREPDEAQIAAEMERASHPFTKPSGDINALRERLMDLMWDDVGVIRDGPAMTRALGRLDEIEAELLSTGVSGDERSFNLTWHDWLNLRSLVEISRVIALAAMKRENSRGAHYREDFAGEGDLATTRFTIARQGGGRIEISDAPVEFTRVKPGETLLKDEPPKAAE